MYIESVAERELYVND
jgi:hypothetical protein